MLSENIKETLYTQIQPIYEKTQTNLKENEIRERIEVFAMALSFSSNCEINALRKIENDITTLLESVERTAKAELSKTNINLIEPYLRLLCLLVDRYGFISHKIETATLLTLYKHDKLDVLKIRKNPKRSEYLNILSRRDQRGEPILYGDPRHPENVLNNDIEVFP